MNINLPFIIIIALFFSLPLIVFNMSTDNQNSNLKNPAVIDTTYNQGQHHNLLLGDENSFTILSSDSSGSFNEFAHDSVGTKYLLFNMPIFVPDSVLTSSMPILIPPPVDEGMIIPIN